MAGSMSQVDLVSDLKASLHDAVSAFKAPDDADFVRLLGLAAAAMQMKRPRTLLGMITLVAGLDVYALPAPIASTLASYKTHAWAQAAVKPWDPAYPGAVPRVCVDGQPGAWQLVFNPAPTALQISVWGSGFRFWYFALHSVGASAGETTIAEADRGLLLLRAQAEAMRELSLHNVNKAVQMRDGFSGAPRNSTPAALYEALLREWKEAA